MKNSIIETILNGRHKAATTKGAVCKCAGVVAYCVPTAQSSA